MPISGCHDLPLATFNSPVVNTRPTPEQPPRKKQHRHSGIFRVADLGPGTMPRGKYPESPAPAGSHALISRTPTPGGMLHANLGLPRPPLAWLQLSRGQHTPDTGATSKEKNNIVIPEFSAWLTLVLERCRAENIRNLPRQRAPTPLFPERRPTPGGMLHANLGLPRPPPRNFQLSRGQHTPDTGATSKEKNNIVIPEFSAWLTLVLERCRAENIRNLPRQRAPTPLFPERRPREACSMPISGCHDLPLATFNSPVVNTRPTPEQPPKKKTTSSFRNFPRG